MKEAFKVLSKYSFKELFHKFAFRIYSFLNNFYWNNYYAKNRISVVDEKTKLSNFSIETPKIKTEQTISEYLVSKYHNHKFQILNVNWLSFNYTIPIDKDGKWLDKVLHKNHSPAAKEIWSKIQTINPNYTPINWQLDHITGFSFSANLSHTKQRQFIQDGIEIKHPWELARLYHLVQLAHFAEEGEEKIIKEVKCQIYDFIMCNPPGMGVNWECTMEVGIRISNMLLAFDWLKQKDKTNILDEQFEALFTQYVYQHGKYIVNHFEYKKGLTANHYLGNIAGLAFISSYLEPTEEILKWQMLSQQELSNETQLQFFEDGSNFEGSTSYHKLSAEMIVYATAILEKSMIDRKNKFKKVKSFNSFFGPSFKTKNILNFQNNSIFNASHYARIYKMGQFVEAYSKSNHNIVQIGDNDSGSFLKLSPIGAFYSKTELEYKYFNVKNTENKLWVENNINHNSLINLISGFFESNTNVNNSSIEFEIIKNLVTKKETPKKSKEINFTYNEFKKLEFTQVKEIAFSDYNYALETNIEINHFKDFGFVSYKAENLFLSIYYGANEKALPSWGHQHNDKLSFELTIKGENIFVDPGTYAYSSNPKLRNKFRSNFSHNNVVVNNEEQNLFPNGIWGLFNYYKRVNTKLISLNKDYIIISNQYDDYLHYRKIELKTDKIIITDSCSHKFEQIFNNTLFSDGYGKLNKSIN